MLSLYQSLGQKELVNFLCNVSYTIVLISLINTAWKELLIDSGRGC